MSGLTPLLEHGVGEEEEVAGVCEEVGEDGAFDFAGELVDGSV